MWNPCGLVMTTFWRRTSPVMAGARLTLDVIDQVPDDLAGGGLAEGPDEAVVPQAAGDVFQGPQVVAGTVLGRDEQDEHVDRLAVEAVEAHPRARQGHGADEAVHAAVLGVGDGHAAADAGGAEQLALEDRLDDVLRLVPLEVAGGPQA